MVGSCCPWSKMAPNRAYFFSPFRAVSSSCPQSISNPGGAVSQKVSKTLIFKLQVEKFCLFKLPESPEKYKDKAFSVLC